MPVCEYVNEQEMLCAALLYVKVVSLAVETGLWVALFAQRKAIINKEVSSSSCWLLLHLGKVCLGYKVENTHN